MKKIPGILFFIIFLTPGLFPGFSQGSMDGDAGQEQGFYSKISVSEAMELIERKNPVILDVRTQEEFDSGHIPGAILIPVQVLAEKIDLISEYKDVSVLVYCRSGNRSTTASKILLDNGFEKIYNLGSGFSDWIRKGQPVE